jgi:hypothetical protein
MFIASARSPSVFAMNEMLAFRSLRKHSLMQSEGYKHAAPNGAGAAHSENTIGLMNKFTWFG